MNKHAILQAIRIFLSNKEIETHLYNIKNKENLNFPFAENLQKLLNFKFNTIPAFKIETIKKDSIWSFKKKKEIKKLKTNYLFDINDINHVYDINNIKVLSRDSFFIIPFRLNEKNIIQLQIITKIDGANIDEQFNKNEFIEINGEKFLPVKQNIITHIIYNNKTFNLNITELKELQNLLIKKINTIKQNEYRDKEQQLVGFIQTYQENNQLRH